MGTQQETLTRAPRRQAGARPAPSKPSFLTGRRVALRGLQRSDCAAMAPWLDDHDVTGLLFMGGRPANIELMEEEWARDSRDPNMVAFAVCTNPGRRFIGTTGLYGINWIMRTAEFRIFLGDKTSWNQGIGTECAKLVVSYGFDKLNLNRIWLGVNADNAGGVRAYEKAGFVREGVLRQEQYRNFRYDDVIRMAILRSEYETVREGFLAA